jgi:hypothetical protein
MTSTANNDEDPAGMDGVASGGTTDRRVRPIGAWVVAAFLLFATLAMWTLVSIIFYAYS